MIRDGFRPGRVFPEGRVDGDILRPVPFLGLHGHALAVIGPLDPEQVVRLDGQAGLPPAGFKDRLGDRQGRQNPGRGHVGRREGADLVNKRLLFLRPLRRGRRGVVGRLRRVGIVDIGKAAVFRPGPRVVAGLLSDVPDGRDLDLVFPFRGTLDGQSVADIHADMTGQPDSFAGDHVGPAGGRSVGTFRDHSVGADVRDAVHSVAGAAVDLRLVPGPPPQDALQQTHTVKTEGVGGSGLDHSGPGRVPVVGMIVTVSGLIGRRHRGAKTPHDIQGLILRRDLDQFVDEDLTFHHCFSLHTGRAGVRAPALHADYSSAWVQP